MQKRGDTKVQTNVLWHVILAIGLIMLFSLFIVKACTRGNTAAADDSFTHLTNVIEQTHRDPLASERTKVDLKLEKKWVVLAFPSGSSKASFAIKEGSTTKKSATFERPKLCGDRSCLCLCREYEKKGATYQCTLGGKTSCSTYDFPLAGHCGRRDGKTDVTDIACSSGVAFARKFEGYSPDLSRVVWVERAKINDDLGVGVCEHAPCIEEKKTATS